MKQRSNKEIDRMSIAENVAAVRARIEAAAQGRRGLTTLGENRVQELVEKNEQHAYDGAPLHFIGHLQKNKIKYLVGVADMIESVDSEELLTLIDRRAEKLGVTQDVLLEVNIGREEAKSGLAPEDVLKTVEFAASLAHVRVRGLMAIPPVGASADDSRPYFAAMRELFIDIGAKKYDNTSMDFLSMGMSGDFEAAIEEGANVVRVGSAIFGARDYSRPVGR